MTGPRRIGDDASATLRFTFDGRPLRARPGDTLAAALLANGIGLVARSFKYHRPRGIMAAGVEEPSALVTVGEGGRTEPNTKATDVFVYDGLVARSQNRWPSLGFDLGALNGLAARFLPAGFYYKTFFGPPSRWMVYEKFIRRAAGMGRAPTEADPDRYEHRAAFCDVLVVGGGSAGRAAAAAADGRVMLVEQDRVLGGDVSASSLFVPSAVEGPATRRGAGCLDFTRRERGGGDGSAHPCPRADAHYGDGRLGSWFRHARRASRRARRGAAAWPAGPAALAHPRRAHHPRHRRDRAAAHLRRQRPPGASCCRRRCAPISRASGCYPAGASSSLPTMTTPMPPPRRSWRRAARSSRSSIHVLISPTSRAPRKSVFAFTPAPSQYRPRGEGGIFARSRPRFGLRKFPSPPICSRCRAVSPRSSTCTARPAARSTGAPTSRRSCRAHRVRRSAASAPPRARSRRSPRPRRT